MSDTQRSRTRNRVFFWGVVRTHVVDGGDKEQDGGGHMEEDDEEEDDQHGVCLRTPDTRNALFLAFEFADGPRLMAVFVLAVARAGPQAFRTRSAESAGSQTFCV